MGLLRATLAITAVEVSSSVHRYPGAARRKAPRLAPSMPTVSAVAKVVVGPRVQAPLAKSTPGPRLALCAAGTLAVNPYCRPAADRCCTLLEYGRQAHARFRVLRLVVQTRSVGSGRA